MADDELTPPTEEPSDDQPDKDWEAEANKWKGLARKHEKSAKDTPTRDSGTQCDSVE